MRVLHLTAHEGTGAGRAAARLHAGLRSQGIDSTMLVSERTLDTPHVIKPPGALNIIKRLQPIIVRGVLDRTAIKPGAVFSANLTPSLLQSTIHALNPDVIHLHWIGWEFLRIEELRTLGKPLVWTLHDSWAFTGGCHIPFECEHYKTACGMCPQLRHPSRNDLSAHVWKRKARAWKNLTLHLVTPGHWMAQCVRDSGLLKDQTVRVIPNGVDPMRFKPIDRQTARTILNLPLDKTLIVFGAMNSTSDHNKGFHLLQPALRRLAQQGRVPETELLVFGASQPDNPPDFGFPAHYLGRLGDEVSVALVYAACDVFVAPSLSDNFPNTVLEAIACGRPCVAFQIGGMPDLIEHHTNGALARPYETDDLAAALEWVLEDEGRRQELGRNARLKFERQFTLTHQTSAYQSLYQEILQS